MPDYFKFHRMFQNCADELKSIVDPYDEHDGETGEQLALEFYDVITSYAFDGLEPNETTAAEVLACFELARSVIDADRTAQEAGRKGGRPPKQDKT